MKDSNKFDKDEFSYLNLGEKMPEFFWINEAGEKISSETLKSKESLLIFFSETCPHCVENFNFLKPEFPKFDFSKITILAIGRECDASQVESYIQEHSVSIPSIPDPDRNIYSKFAEKIVPRMYHFDKDGVLLGSLRGYKPMKLREFLKSLKA